MGLSAMTVRSFSGPAGCGKTFQLMAALSGVLRERPLQNGEKVLALTFMHGSRRRLDERLAALPISQNRYECSTLDSFAWRLVRRWQTLLLSIGHQVAAVADYELICAQAAQLLAHRVVTRWAACAFPIVVVDEAQDLTPNRLAIIQQLANHVELLVASDEFQCLSEDLRPNRACEWLAGIGGEMVLAQPWRTNDRELLAAARAVRDGEQPQSGRQFKVVSTPNVGMAATWISNGISWNRQGNRVAIITPTMGDFARSVHTWIETRTTTRGNGPHRVLLEEAEVTRCDRFLEGLVLPDELEARDAHALMEGHPRTIGKAFTEWVDRQRRCQGRTEFTRNEVEMTLRQLFSNQRRMSSGDGAGVRALTVHGAKNREFDVVFVLWPAAIGGDAIQKRRLLYNAITRARRSCVVLVQSTRALQAPPFV